MGTGTSIGDGLVVTAAHVVAGADQVEVVDEFGDTTAADVVLFDPALDVAALRPGTTTGTAGTASVRFRPRGRGGSHRDPIGRWLDRVGRRRGGAHVTILTTDIYLDEQVQRPGLRVTATIEPGDSGAMVHLAGGGVGIVWSRSTERPDRAWTVDLRTNSSVLRHVERSRPRSAPARARSPFGSGCAEDPIEVGVAERAGGVELGAATRGTCPTRDSGAPA